MLTASLFALMLTVSPADADREVRRVSVYDGHVSLEVPADWEEIPPELLESHSLQMAESTGGRLTESYQHGFRSLDPEIDFVLPECLIQIRESGRLRYPQFLDLPSAEDMPSVGEDLFTDRSGSAVGGMELRNAAFDHDTFSLHLRNTLELSYESETSVESVAFLTERGLFTVHFYARASRAGAMAPIYARIIDSISFDDELRYRPRMTDRLPSRLPLILLASAALIAAIAASVHLLQRRRRKP
jgi:hypothetical protein